MRSELLGLPVRGLEVLLAGCTIDAPVVEDKASPTLAKPLQQHSAQVQCLL